MSQDEIIIAQIIGYPFIAIASYFLIVMRFKPVTKDGISLALASALIWPFSISAIIFAWATLRGMGLIDKISEKIISSKESR